MKKKSGNISILVIFVLLASSLLGVLSLNYVQQMMKQSATVQNYYKAYYLSKAGIELGLSAITYRGVGFEYILHTGDAIVRDNFFSGYNFSLAMNISGTASLLSQKFWQGSGCESPYILSGGDSLIVPLFRDTTPGKVIDMFSSGVKYENLANLFKDNQINFVLSGLDKDVTFGILILSGQDLYENGIFFKKGTLDAESLSQFRSDFEAYMTEVDRDLANYYGTSQLIEKGFTLYFMISNSTSSEKEFCIQTVQTSPLTVATILPTDTFFLQSQASFGDQRVGLDASYAQPIPGFLFGAYSSY